MAETSISRKLDEICISINSLQNTVINMQVHTTEIREDAKVTRTAIYGNGSTDAGMMGRIKILENWKDSQMWSQRALMTALISEGIGLIGFVIYALIAITK